MKYLNEKKYNDVKWRVNNTISEIRNYLSSTSASGFVIGMSGGLDCAVVAALCVQANIPILAIALPYEKEKSKQRQLGVEHAKELCDKFEIELIEIDITEEVKLIYKNSDKYLKDVDEAKLAMSKANVLPRVRMTNLYYFAQTMNCLVIGTGNLSEITMGYFTKWGDGASDFNPVRKFTKTEMFELAEFLEIPVSIIYKKPSADLWDEQTDEDEMGLNYEQIDIYIRTGEGPEEVKEIIENAKIRNKHKISMNMLAD